MSNRKLFTIVALLGFLGMFAMFSFSTRPKAPIVPVEKFRFRSIDTMKFSRDPVREEMKNPAYEKLVDRQVSEIAKTGASHVAIATPYDDEFLPALKLWVKSARKHGLKVWFRGNFSGWEQWFDYEKITPQDHALKLEKFILSNPTIFSDGDVFSACPECENGGPGDPRTTGKVLEFRNFMTLEFKIAKKAFGKIGKEVNPGFASMNGDVANLIMDRNTTSRMGGIVVVDHYVRDPLQLRIDARRLAQKSGGKIIFGEFGAPIPDINGEMTEDEQQNWLNRALSDLAQEPEVIGLSYWTSFGGSTAIWNEDGSPRKAVNTLKKYY